MHWHEINLRMTSVINIVTLARINKNEVMIQLYKEQLTYFITKVGANIV